MLSADGPPEGRVLDHLLFACVPCPSIVEHLARTSLADERCSLLLCFFTSSSIAAQDCLIRGDRVSSDAIRRALRCNHLSHTRRSSLVRCHQAGTQMQSPVSYEANAAELLASAAKESAGRGPMPVAE